MTLLLYILLFTFILIEAPLITLMVYLYNRSTNDPATSRMRQVIFIIALAKSIFILAQIILILNSLPGVPKGTTFVISTYSGAAIFLAIVDWWSLFQIRRIIK